MDLRDDNLPSGPVMDAPVVLIKFKTPTQRFCPRDKAVSHWATTSLDKSAEKLIDKQGRIIES